MTSLAVTMGKKTFWKDVCSFFHPLALMIFISPMRREFLTQFAHPHARTHHTVTTETFTRTDLRLHTDGPPAGLTNDLYEFDPAGPAWRTRDPGSSGPVLPFEPLPFVDSAGPAEGPGGDDGVVLRPKARAQLGMVGDSAGVLYVFGGKGPKDMAGSMETGV
jgi:hypothetical protein